MKYLVVLVLIASLVVIGTTAINASPPVSGNDTQQILYGDANRNGAVSIGDVVKIERIILGMDPSVPEADANQDGVINMADVITVEKMILGLPYRIGK